MDKHETSVFSISEYYITTKCPGASPCPNKGDVGRVPPNKKAEGDSQIGSRVAGYLMNVFHCSV